MMEDSRQSRVDTPAPHDSGMPAFRPLPARLDDVRWRLIVEHLPPLIRARAINGGRTRGFLEAVMWVATTQQPWSRLPRDFGAWHSIYVRFTRWAQDGVWDHIITSLQAQGDAAEPLRRLVISYLRASHLPRHRSAMRPPEGGLPG
jgi:transposase